MLSTCGDYVEDMLIFAQCSINILSNQHKGTSTEKITQDGGLPLLHGRAAHLLYHFEREAVRGGA